MPAICAGSAGAGAATEGAAPAATPESAPTHICTVIPDIFAWDAAPLKAELAMARDRRLRSLANRRDFG